tara:strand:- start:3556 stop:3813 length:258 start_codon:yes stop_codon:yes gene_type:complete
VAKTAVQEKEKIIIRTDKKGPKKKEETQRKELRTTTKLQKNRPRNVRGGAGEGVPIQQIENQHLHAQEKAIPIKPNQREIEYPWK